jgi:NAD(P)-dependent dehydrogenase (short-subunit alcohol dehydrogenase family)
MGRLDGRVALVTGAGRGFGRAIALAFGREGADVAVNYNASAAGAKEVVTGLEQLGRRAEAVRADVARADQVGAMVDQVLARFGRLDILVNNAGVMTRGPSSTPRSRATSRCSRST